MPAPTGYELFELGDLPLQHGQILRGATLAYKTYGTLNADKSNVILHPTWFSAWHDANEWTIEPGFACDPGRYFIVVPNQINNGLSTSPSNNPPPFNGPYFPPVTFYDQVEAQYRLLTQKWGIESLELVLGSSMGAAQTYQWAVSHPEMVKRAAPIVGSPKTSEHNQVFLKSLRATLTLDPVFDGGIYSPDAPPTRGLRAFARIYAGWGSPRRSTGSASTGRWATPRSRTSWSVTGRASGWTTVTPTTCSPCCGPGRTATSGRLRGSTETPRQRCGPFAARSSPCLPEPISTSRPRTSSGGRSSSRAVKSASSTPSTVTSPASAYTNPTIRSSTRRWANC